MGRVGGRDHRATAPSPMGWVALPGAEAGKLIRGVDIEERLFVVEWNLDAPKHGLPLAYPSPPLSEKIFQAWPKAAPAQANRAVNLSTTNRDGNVCAAFIERGGQSFNQIVRQKWGVARHAYKQRVGGFGHGAEEPGERPLKVGGCIG